MTTKAEKDVRAFAVDWSTKSKGKIAQLASAYLRKCGEVERLRKAIRNAYGQPEYCVHYALTEELKKVDRWSGSIEASAVWSDSVEASVISAVANMRAAGFDPHEHELFTDEDGDRVLLRWRPRGKGHEL